MIARFLCTIFGHRWDNWKMWDVVCSRCRSSKPRRDYERL